MNSFTYNNYGQQQTGFDNLIDHSLYGHWSNPEYQQDSQEFEESMQIQDSINETHIPSTTDDSDYLPF